MDLPLRRRGRLSETLVLHLARDIVGGRLRPGDPAPPEAELVSRFEMSKPVVRESVQSLVNLGMLRVQQGKRTQVLEPHEWNVLSPVVQQAFLLEGRADRLTAKIYEIRLALETRAAAWAAERALPDAVAQIHAFAQRLEEIARTGDVAEFLAVDQRLHAAIALSSDNEILLGVLRDLQSYLVRAWTHSRVRARHLEQLAMQHSAVADAIASHDGPAAALAMENHLRWAMQLEASTGGHSSDALVGDGIDDISATKRLEPAPGA